MYISCKAREGCSSSCSRMMKSMTQVKAEIGFSIPLYHMVDRYMCNVVGSQIFSAIWIMFDVKGNQYQLTRKHILIFGWEILLGFGQGNRRISRKTNTSATIGTRTRSSSIWWPSSGYRLFVKFHILWGWCVPTEVYIHILLHKLSPTPTIILIVVKCSFQCIVDSLQGFHKFHHNQISHIIDSISFSGGPVECQMKNGLYKIIGPTE